MKKYPPTWLSWLTWGFVANLYMIGFFQRLAPAVMVNELMREFELSGALMGNLSAAYFYAYAAMQIPSGLLADSIGPRRLSTIACFTAAIGIFMFALATNLLFAYVGRFLIGASVAVAFVTCMKLAGHWFPPNRFASVTGISLMIGNIGGILAGMPLVETIAAFGWRTAMVASGLMTLLAAAATWLFVRNDPSEKGYRSHAHVRVMEKGPLPWTSALKYVALRKDTWLLFFAGGLSAAPVLVFSGLWGVPYLTQVHSIEPNHAAVMTSTILVAWAFGGPAIGAISDRIKRRKAPYLLSNFIAALLWGIFLYGNLPKQWFYPLFAAIGFTSGGVIVGFAFAREANHPNASGAVGGLVNMSVLGFAAVMQPALGMILDQHWDGTTIASARVYDAYAYSSAFVWIFICTGISVLMVAFTKETHCKIADV